MALVVVLIVAAALSATSTAGAATKPSVHIAITQASCAPQWTAPPAGRVTFVVENRTTGRSAIYLYNPYTGITFSSRTGLAPGATSILHVDLKPGNYTWGCHVSGDATHQSVDATVRPPAVMTAAGPTTEIPVAGTQLLGPLQDYRSYISQQLALLGTQVAALQSAIAGGQLGQAEAAWLTAHLTWQRMGAAYDAFGTLGTLINGLATGQNVGQSPGTGGVTPFEGFHKVELDLWGDQDLASAAADTAQLATNVSTLTSEFPLDDIAPAELPLRAHEILEDSLRDELSGDDDYGSGTDMASVQADVSGEEFLLHLLTPLLQQRAPELIPRATVQLNRLDAALAATKQGGNWVAVAQVPLAQRERVDGAIGAALEILAIIPDVMPVTGSTL